jgi:Zn-dependent M28 family amino/carboxypeptidase
VVTAHYDHVGVQNGTIYNGADDNASGTAALLVIADELRRNPPEHSVIIAALDAEEAGLSGARAFVDAPPVPPTTIRANLNLDMVGRNEAGELWAAGTFHYPQLLPLVQEVAQRAPVKLRIGHDRPGVIGEDDWTMLSDHGPFHAKRIPFLYLGVEDHADYHKPTDDAERIEPGFYGRAVATVIALLRELDEFLPR